MQLYIFRYRHHVTSVIYFYLVLLHLHPETHIIFQEVSFQRDKMLELLAAGGVQQNPAKQHDLYGRIHPQALHLQRQNKIHAAFKSTFSQF